MNALAGRVCAVTGGAAGIGWAISQALAEQGATVHIGDYSAEHLGRRRAAVAGTDFFGKHVDSAAIPRLADYLPYATPSEVAGAMVNAFVKRKSIVDVPRSAGWLHRHPATCDLSVHYGQR